MIRCLIVNTTSIPVYYKSYFFKRCVQIIAFIYVSQILALKLLQLQLVLWSYMSKSTSFYTEKSTEIPPLNLNDLLRYLHA